MMMMIMMTTTDDDDRRRSPSTLPQYYLPPNIRTTRQDGNEGLVLQCLDAIPGHYLRQQSKSYLSLSLAEIAQSLGQASLADTERLVRGLVGRGRGGFMVVMMIPRSSARPLVRSPARHLMHPSAHAPVHPLEDRRWNAGGGTD